MARGELDAAQLHGRIESMGKQHSARFSADATAFLLENQKGLRMHRIMLTFKSSGECRKDANCDGIVVLYCPITSSVRLP